MRELLPLRVLSEKALHQAADSRLVAYCPSMDLVALGSTDQQVLIYRLNGQRVYGTTQKAGTVRAEKIRWKPNGQLLAVAWSDGVVRLVGAESSKTVHQISTSDQGVTGITCMGWASNLTSRKTNSTTSKKAQDSWKNFLTEDTSISGARTLLDLPRDLTLLDIETSLPKLSVLAAGGTS
jgi:anaphase-promoting complex subunit 4